MGTVSSRNISSSMPGSLSMMDVPRSCPESAKNDDGVARKDVIDEGLSQACDHYHSNPLELISSGPTRGPSPDPHSIPGCKDPAEQPRNATNSPDLSTPQFIPEHTKSLQSNEDSKASPTSSGASTPLTPPSTPSSVLTHMSTVQFHSPSSQIVGTPFATNSAPFEYPFPATPHNSTASMAYFPSPASSSLSIAPPSPGLSPISKLSNTLSLSLSLDFSHPSQLSLTHPKMQKASPPIPPSLLKKRKDRLQMQARRSTVDVSDKVNGHEPIHHTFSDSNMRRNGHGLRA